MCGFVVAVGPRFIGIDESHDFNSLANRGPDDHTLISQAGRLFYHSRLRIVGGSENDQPVYSQSGRYLMVFNGEIYNYKELSKRFDLKGCEASDSRVVVELYELLKEKALEHLDGMFAIVIQDLQSGEIFAARDRLGIKPLYFYSDRENKIFSSDIATILDFFPSIRPRKGVQRELIQLRGYLPNLTYYQGVIDFPPASYFSNGSFTRYWALEPIHDKPSEEKLGDLLLKSVEKRIPHGLSFGGFLSGGVDSGIINHLARPNLAISLGSRRHNEFREAQELADGAGISFDRILISDLDFESIHRELVSTYREPVLVPNTIHLAVGSKKLSELDKKVVFSGEGADELFGGYERLFSLVRNLVRWDFRRVAETYSYSATPDLELFEEAFRPFSHFGRPDLILTSFLMEFHLRGLLRRLDIATMHSGVEARNPFLDTELIQAFWSAEVSWKIPANQGKLPLRLWASKYLGDLAFREKIGFPVVHSKSTTKAEASSRHLAHSAFLRSTLRLLEE